MHGNASSNTRFITFTHIYTSICTFHSSKWKKMLKSEGGGVVIRTRFSHVLIAVWLPWKCFIIPEVYQLYAHLHIHTFHPSKYEKSVEKQTSYLHNIFNVFTIVWLP